MDAVVVAEGPSKQPPPLSAAAEVRVALLARLRELDRGSRATHKDAADVARLVEQLEEEAAKAGRWRPSFPRDLPELDGRWRLAYASGFAGTEGGFTGRRPGVALDTPMLQIGEIHQRYRIEESKVDTSIMFRPPGWLQNSGVLNMLPVINGNADTELTLTQQFDVAKFDTLRFAFTDGQVVNRVIALAGVLRFPLALLGFTSDTSKDTPFTDTLEITYCDGELRIGVVGRNNELRVWVRA